MLPLMQGFVVSPASSLGVTPAHSLDVAVLTEEGGWQM